jgi:antitoxin component of MazEF toxin-antitoxin module
VIKKLTKHGNSQVIVIDKPILELLGWDKDTVLKLSTPDGKRIVISKVEPKST